MNHLKLKDEELQIGYVEIPWGISTFYRNDKSIRFFERKKYIEILNNYIEMSLNDFIDYYLNYFDRIVVWKDYYSCLIFESKEELK